MVSEQDIIKKEPSNPMKGWDEESIRDRVEKMGVDFGRTAYVYGSAPNRLWTNDPTDFNIEAAKDTTLHVKKNG